MLDLCKDQMLLQLGAPGFCCYQGHGCRKYLSTCSQGPDQLESGAADYSCCFSKTLGKQRCAPQAWQQEAALSTYTVTAGEIVEHQTAC